jgi:putative membrane protein
MVGAQRIPRPVSRASAPARRPGGAGAGARLALGRRDAGRRLLPGDEAVVRRRLAHEFLRLPAHARRRPHRDRIQRITVAEGFLARFVPRRWLSCDVAAGARAHEEGAEQKRLKWLAPIAHPARVDAIATSLDPALALDTLEWRPLHRRAAKREFRPALFVSTVAAVPVAAFAPVLAASGWIALVAWTALYARGWARFAAWACDGRVLAYRAGWLTRKWTIARIAKGQVLTVAISPFDRRHRMASVRLDTAGSTSSAFSLDVPYLDERDARALAARVRAGM